MRTLWLAGARTIVALALPMVAAGPASADSSGQATPPASPSGERSERSVALASELATLLSGTFAGSTPGNSLKAIVTSIMSPVSPTQFDLPMTITGKYGDSGVRLQGVIRLQNQGRGVLLQYTPHFDPVVGGLSSQLQFTPQELEATCNFDVAPRGDGFSGETVGSTTCVRAIRGAVGKWSFEVDPGAIRIRNSGTGETLRFKKTSK